MFAIQKKKDGDSVKYYQNNQNEVVTEVGKSFSSTVKVDTVKIDSTTEKLRYKVSTNNISNTKDTISIENDAIIQRCFFGANILFESGASQLKENGSDVIKTFGKVLKKHLSSIKEIQIQGHADNKAPEKNIKLAFDRANEVFNVLNNEIGISPYEHLTSIVSYSDFKPVDRKDDELKWTESDNIKANIDEYKQSLNRRIEIVLIYRAKKPQQKISTKKEKR
jgi:outer membrane protein OmpA-like peptidoglycan-associated protein